MKNPSLTSSIKSKGTVIIDETKSDSKNELKDIQQRIDESGVDVPKKRGRPAGSKNKTEKEIPVEQLEKIQREISNFVLLTGLILDWAADRMPIKIPTTELEKKLITESLEKVLVDLSPSLVVYFPYITLISSSAIWFIPRSGILNRKKKNAEKNDSYNGNDGKREIPSDEKTPEIV